MYAIVKTGGKQYKVAPGDRINIEKLDAEVGAEVELPVICVVDGETVEADPAKAAATKVVATVIEQFKGEKVLVFKFKSARTTRSCAAIVSSSLAWKSSPSAPLSPNR